MVVSAQVTIGASGEPSHAGPREPEQHAAFSVLLIEDNEADAYLVCDSLANSEPGRFKITQSDRLASGLACLSHESFDLVLLDLSLPDSDGFETFRRRRIADTLDAGHRAEARRGSPARVGGALSLALRDGPASDVGIRHRGSQVPCGQPGCHPTLRLFGSRVLEPESTRSGSSRSDPDDPGVAGSSSAARATLHPAS